MDDARLSLTEQAATLAQTWEPSVFGGKSRLERAVDRLVDAATAARDFTPLLGLLHLPDVDQADGALLRVTEALLDRPECVEPLVRMRVEGAGDGSGRDDAAAAERAHQLLIAMAPDVVVPALLRVADGDAAADVREAAFNQLLSMGPDAVSALEELSSDDELGSLAARCLRRIEELDLVPDYAAADDVAAVDDLLYAYRQAEEDDDADYALDQLAALLQEREWPARASALEPVRQYIRECVEGFMNSGDEEEEDAVLAELEYFVGACGDAGRRMLADEAGRIPVVFGTRRLHELAALLGPSRADAGGSSMSLTDATGRLPAADLLELTGRPQFRHALQVLRSLFAPLTSLPEGRAGRLAPAELEALRRVADWTRPAGLPPPAGDAVEERSPDAGTPSADGDDERWIVVALTILCNDADDDMKAVAALSLLGVRDAVPMLWAVEDDPVGGLWVGRVLGWDVQLAEAEGVGLSAWAATPEPDGPAAAIDELLAGVQSAAEDDGESAAAPVDAPPLPAGPIGPSETTVETGEPAELAEAPEGLPLEPMPPPGLASMDEAFEEFARRLEREPGA